MTVPAMDFGGVKKRVKLFGDSYNKNIILKK